MTILQYSNTPVFSFPAFALGCLLCTAPVWSAKVVTTPDEYNRQLTETRNREERAAASIAEEQAKIAEARQLLLDVEKRAAEVEVQPTDSIFVRSWWCGTCAELLDRRSTLRN